MDSEVEMVKFQNFKVREMRYKNGECRVNFILIKIKSLYALEFSFQFLLNPKF